MIDEPWHHIVRINNNCMLRIIVLILLFQFQDDKL